MSVAAALLSIAKAPEAGFSNPSISNWSVPTTLPRTFSGAIAELAVLNATKLRCRSLSWAP